VWRQLTPAGGAGCSRRQPPTAGIAPPPPFGAGSLPAPTLLAEKLGVAPGERGSAAAPSPALDRVIHVELDRVGRHLEALDLGHLELEAGANRVVGENRALREEVAVPVEAVERLALGSASGRDGRPARRERSATACGNSADPLIADGASGPARGMDRRCHGSARRRKAGSLHRRMDSAREQHGVGSAKPSLRLPAVAARTMPVIDLIGW
jgi:hypothetical protein